MNAGSDWSSSRALLTLKPSPRRWTLNSTWAIQQTARNCAEQFSILSPGEKCQSKKGVVENSLVLFPNPKDCEDEVMSSRADSDEVTKSAIQPTKKRVGKLTRLAAR